ncbi:hypothetical protein EJN64_06425 [Salmonella enterica]|nr:hypothetical protein [Salmonella enterica]EEC5248753.1 hypothetical protein [Salmonella enterica subsp. enterica]MJY36638.1 hypothetical protein [Salmonella enterica subsp. enterica serovar Abony]
MRGGAKIERRGVDTVYRQRMKSLKDIEITVGIHQGQQHDGLDIATYAAWNNFGTKNSQGEELIPARPFMKFSSEEIAKWMKTEEYRGVIRQVMRGEIKSVAAAHFIGRRASKIVSDTLKKSNLYVQNSAVTIAMKNKGGVNKKVLENSGYLFNAPTYRVRSR